MAYYLGLDAGGTFIKAGIYDAKGVELAVEKKISTTLHPQKGWVERDLTSLFDEACAVIQAVIHSSGISGKDIKAMAISAQGKGVFLLDKKGENLRNGILSADSRSIDIVKTWQQNGLHSQIYPLTKQNLWTGHPATILHWLKKNEPKTYGEIGTVFMMHDYLRYCFTGEKHCEITNISESNLFNAQASDYDDALFDIFELSDIRHALPPLIAPDELAGYIKPDLAQKLGLSHDVKVFGGLFDVVATALCASIGTEEKINAVMGTWSVSSIITHKLKYHEDYPYVYGHYIQKGEYIIHEASPTSASNFEWFIQQFEEADIDYAQINKQVEKAPMGDILFTPFVYGSNVALGVKAGFYGLTAHHQKGDIYRAIYEGIVFCHLVHLKRLMALFPHVKTLRITGGATQSDIWMQIFADITGFDIEILDINETGCRAAAMIAAKGNGEFLHIYEAFSAKDIPIRSLTACPKQHIKYQDKYEKYLKYTDLLKNFEKDE